MRLINSLIEGLNKRPRLPRFVLFLVDNDIMDEMNTWEPDSVVIKNFNTILMWLGWQVNILFKRRCLDLSDRNPGAVFGNDPRIIWVKMLRRTEFYPLNSRLGKMCAICTKFNESMNMAVARNEHYIMNVTTCTSKHHFNVCVGLSEAGKKAFWREVNHLMEHFDRNEIQLLPAQRSSKPARKLHGYKDNY